MSDWMLGPHAKEWLQQPSVVKWNGRIMPGSFRTYYGYLCGFLTDVHKTPDELVAWGKSVKDPYEVLDAIQTYVRDLKGKRHATKRIGYAAIRSFLMHNRVILPKDPSFRIKSDLPPVERNLTIENVRELIGLATQPLRSMLLVKWQGILDTESLLYVSNTQAETITKALQENTKILKVSIPGRKHMRNEKPLSDGSVETQ